MKNSYNGHDTLCECDACEAHDKKIIDELDREAYLQVEWDNSIQSYLNK